MLTPQQKLLGRLDHIAYNLKAMGAFNYACGLRIKEELIDKVPPETYGNPPAVLSRPLTIEQVRGWFENSEKWSFDYAKELREILKAIVGGDIWP